MRFVFLDCPNLPALDGRVAQVDDHDECSLYYSEVLKSADWALSYPGIHLRYFLEDWTDRLLSWIKHFFVPDLQYWHWEDLHGWEKHCRRLMQACEEAGPNQARQDTFQDLLDDFSREAEKWAVTILGGPSPEQSGR